MTGRAAREGGPFADRLEVYFEPSLTDAAFCANVRSTNWSPYETASKC
ncbi:hypothetical protein BC777_0241 [Yoonia maricola]|uniref:Uncharacterized protein n=1 Tax=Yoonia maricola TaxID=420999 RepID=A0A2M8WKF3_9RHOB|nr:hypothetical protein BC777_0241 [Yoonia maricola]